MLVLGKIRDFLNLEKNKNSEFQIKNSAKGKTPIKNMNETKFVELTFYFGS